MHAINVRCNVDYCTVWRIMTRFVFTFVSLLSELFSQKRMCFISIRFVLFCSVLLWFVCCLIVLYIRLELDMHCARTVSSDLIVIQIYDDLMVIM